MVYHLRRPLFLVIPELFVPIREGREKIERKNTGGGNKGSMKEIKTESRN
jgi:hypothetical protein